MENHKTLISLFFGIIFISHLSLGSIRYVKGVATGNTSGSSWGNASSDLQAMINASSSGDQIWVAFGTYRPSAYPTGCTGCSSNRDFTFFMKNGVSVYGQFAGNESNISQRVLGVGSSILSGDVQSDGVFTNNAYHVVMFANCTSGTTLDGFTVIAGQADDNTSVTVLSSSESPRTIFRVWGGGIVCALSHPTISNCVLIDNLAESGGGMLNTFVSHPTVVNTLIHQNYAVAGAGMYNHVSSNTVLRNTTITRNVASGAGGAMYNFDNSNPNIRACIIWGNIASGSGATLPGIANNSSTPVLSNSIVQDGFTPCVSCPNTNGNIDPQFVNLSDANGLDNILGNADDGLNLKITSPAIESAGMLFEAITDIAGRTRHFDIPFRFNVTPSFSDMGAYENQSTTPQKLYVNIGLSTGLNNGSTWADAFTGPAALQSALNIATEGNEIWVAAGTYKPSQYPPGCTNCTNNRDFSFHLKNGVKMYGGFAGNETNINLRYIDIYQTILSGDINSIGFVTDNVSHVVTSVNDNAITTLDGFTIRDGGDFTTPDEPQIIVETFGIPKTTGGGLYSVSSEMNLKNMKFETNNSKSAGGMFFSQSTLGNFEDCYFANNEAVNDGGGIRFLSSSNISMDKLVFKGNVANNGGAILNQTTNFNAINCIFYDNKSKFFGDASVLFNSQSNASFVNCSIIANPTIGAAASDIVNTTSSTLSLTNTILWGNTSGGPLALVNSSGSTAIVTNSILKGGHSPCTSCPGSNGNIDPKIANSGDSDGIDNKFGTFDDGLALTTNSPALNAGTLVGAPIYDFNGSAVQQNVKDLGAYEFFPLNECQQNRLIADKPLATGNYKAGFVILSNANVAISSIVNLETSKNIMLLPGFTAENGAVFTAKIGENCLMGLE